MEAEKSHEEKLLVMPDGVDDKLAVWRVSANAEK